MAGRQTAIPSRRVTAVEAVTREGSEEQEAAKITTLYRLKRIGENDATLPEYEALCRDLRNRRELATWVGLVPTSWSSGDKQRDRGIGRDCPAGSVEHGAVVVSTAGVASSFPPWIEDWKPKHMICSYDADSAGGRAANRIAVSDPRVITLRPCGAEDCNDMLRRR